MNERITGGCQCGAVRYALNEAPSDPTICHCRMCQKAFGSFFAPFAAVPTSAFTLTRGTLSVFKSSDEAERGFRRECGTPLTFHHVERQRLWISIGSLDQPEKFPPQSQYGVESRLSWFASLPTLPGDRSTEQRIPKLAGRIAASNHQHPDHHTQVWPLEEGKRQ